jgi:hypothetical protein
METFIVVDVNVNKVRFGLMMYTLMVYTKASRMSGSARSGESGRARLFAARDLRPCLANMTHVTLAARWLGKDAGIR